MKSATVIQHIAFEDLGNLASVLSQHHYTMSCLEAGYNDLNQINPLTPDLLVVLGGPIGAYEESVYPFLTDELRLLETRLFADLPTLGICLGAQLMVRALGGRVYPGTVGKEIGWSPIELTEAGKQSALAHLAPEQTFVLHWHGDTFDLPNGAVHLAYSEKYLNQAFSWGHNALGLQFHSEVTAQNLERWLIGHACEIGTIANVSVTQLRTDIHRYAANLEVQSIKAWNAWLEKLQ